VLDARRCISYLTIELRGSIPEELRPGIGWQVFGCDICQDVCPWNRTAPVTPLPAFQPRERLVAPELEWLLSLGVEEFRRVFRGSPVKRAKWRGLIRNACVAAGNKGSRLGAAQRARIRERLASLAAADDEVISEHARWALEQLAAAL
jgi:epoxyqueuosine reductase